MKKTKLILPLIALSSFFLLLPIANNQESVNTDAAYTNEKVYEDDFSGNKIRDEWNLEGNVSLEQIYSSFRLNPSSYEWTRHVVLNKKLTGSYSIKMELTTWNDDGWLGLSLGNASTSYDFTSALGGFVFFSGDQSHVLDIPEDSLKPVGNYTASAFNTIGEKRTIEIQVTAVNDFYSTLQCAIYDKNGTFIKNMFNEPYEYAWSLDGYMGFNSNSKNVEIYSVELFNSDHESFYYDDFSSSTVLYPSSGTVKSEWHSKSFTESELQVGFVNTLNLSQVDSGIVFNRRLALVDNDDIDIAYSIKGNVYLSSMDLNAVTGIEIGKENQKEAGHFFGVRKLSVGYQLYSYSPFTKSEQKEETTSESADMSVQLCIDVYQNGTVVFYTDDLSINEFVPSYDGYLGLFTRSYGASSQAGTMHGGYFSSFALNRNIYLDRSGEDSFNNFNGIKETYYPDIQETVRDYYVSRKEWNVGANVKTSRWRKTDQGNGKLSFKNTTGKSYFGPKIKYKDYVVKFDVKITSTSLTTGFCLGLELGCAYPGLAYENTQSLGIGAYPDAEGVMKTNPFVTNLEFKSEKDKTLLDDTGKTFNLFTEDSEFTLMYVVRDNTVTMHLLRKGEDESCLAIGRSTVLCKENKSTDGYVLVYGANGISFDLDNLSIINLDYQTASSKYIGTTSHQEITRLDFTKDETPTGVNLNNAAIDRKTLKINNGGSIETKYTARNGMLRFTTTNVEDELKIKQGNIEISLFNRDSAKSFVVSDGSSSYKQDLDKYFSFEGAIIETKRLGNTFEIRVLSGNGKLSNIASYSYSYSLALEDSFEKVTISSSGGMARLSSYTYLTFENELTINARNYDKDKDYFNPWTVKDSISQPKGSSQDGCGGEIVSTSAILFILTFVGIVALIIRKRKEAR